MRKLLVAAAVLVALIAPAYADPLPDVFLGHWCLGRHEAGVTSDAHPGNQRSRYPQIRSEPPALHLATAAAVEAAHLQLQENPRVAARQIAHPANLAVVPAHLDATATAARRFLNAA